MEQRGEDMERNEIIAVMNPKLGDGLYCLPIASWLFRERGRRVHWCVSGYFNPHNFITPLLMLQPFTASVTVVDFPFTDYGCGAQPYKWDPRSVPVAKSTLPEPRLPDGLDVFNFGFRSYPDKYISAFYAEEHGFDYDHHYRINLGGPPTI